MLLPFTDSLTRVGKFDAESCFLADRHYSRQSVGGNQFMPPGRTMVLRDCAGLVVFGWLYQEKRDDGQRGINCSIFRNESDRLSIEIILEAEEMAFAEWNERRLFTYIDPSKLATRKRRGAEYCPWPPGRCFREAGWKPLVHKDGTPHRSKSGLHLLVKLLKTS